MKETKDIKQEPESGAAKKRKTEWQAAVKKLPGDVSFVKVGRTSFKSCMVHQILSGSLGVSFLVCGTSSSRDCHNSSPSS